MKKQVKGIIGLSAVLVVLGGGLAALKLTDKSGTDDSEKSSSVSEPVTSAKGAGIVLVEDSTDLPVPLSDAPTGDEHMHPAVGTVKTLDIKNEKGELHLIQLDKTTSEETGETSCRYTLKGYEDVSLNYNLIGTLVNNLNGALSASVIEENCQNIEKFGLDKPVATAELTYESGNKRKYSIGIVNPANPDESYFMVDGSNTVYTIRNSLIANYSLSNEEFVSNVILEKPADEDMPVVQSLVIDRDDIDYNFVIKYGEHSDDEKSGGTTAKHELVEPVHSYLVVDNSSEITNGMFGLTANSIYSVHCTEADIAGAGLDEPFCKVTMTCDDGNEYVLLLSEMFAEENSGTKSYAMLEGGNVIYTVYAENAKWLTVEPIDIASRLIVANYVWNIDSISFNVPGKTNEFKIEPKDSNKELFGSKAEDFVVTRNGEKFNAERYRQLYSFFIRANGEKFALDEKIPEGEPMITIEFNDCYLNEKHSIKFYDYSAMTTLIVVDGEPKFFGGKSYAETLADNIARLDTNEEYVTTWK